MTLVNADDMETNEADNDTVELVLALDSLNIAEPSIDGLTAEEYIEIDNNLVVQSYLLMKNSLKKLFWIK